MSGWSGKVVRAGLSGLATCMGGLLVISLWLSVVTYEQETVEQAVGVPFMFAEFDIGDASLAIYCPGVFVLEEVTPPRAEKRTHKSR
ncbi:hypothetical protein SAMN05880556_104165 [Azospirillum sp. RU38E]|nr:hypothetical protein SAMN05880556_104165 [Azospirillum sp. RU38E]SNS56381.1 hypothetical protein SAMN05880591_104165 [Azospirillum sp. RU37A]